MTTATVVACQFSEEGNVNPLDKQLFDAVLTGDAVAVKRSLDAGANPGCISDGGHSIMTLAFDGGIRAIQRTLAIFPFPDVPDEEGETALGMAVRDGHVEMIEMLIATGANIALPFESCPSILHYAATESKTLRVLDAVLQGASAADLSALDDEKQTPLLAALLFGRTLFAERILDKMVALGLPLTGRIGQDGGTLLHEVASKGTAGMLRILLQSGLSPKETDTNGVSVIACLESRNSPEGERCRAVMREFLASRHAS